MKCRITRDKILYIVLVIFLLADFRFFYLLKFPRILGGAASNKTLVSMCTLLIFIFYTLVLKKICIGKFGVAIIILYGILTINSFFMLLFLNYKLTTIIWALIPYLILLMYFPLKDYLAVEKHYLRFIKVAEILTIVYCALFLIQTQIYTGENSLFLYLDGAINDQYLYQPHLKLRIYTAFEGFIRIFILVVAFELIKNHFSLKKCKFHLSSFLLMFTAILIIDQSRLYLIIIIVSTISMFLVFNKSKLKQIDFIMILISGLGALVLFANNFSSILYSIKDNDGSLYARLGAIIYYLSFSASRWFSGLGIVIPEKNSFYYYMICGPQGIYHYDDIGFFGIYASLGILGAVWYIGIVLYCIRQIKKGDKQYCTLKVGLVIMLLLSLPTMSYLDKQRISSLMLTMAVIDAKSHNLC